MNTQENPWKLESAKSIALLRRSLRGACDPVSSLESKWASKPRCKRARPAETADSEHKLLDNLIEDSKYILRLRYSEDEDVPALETWKRATNYLRRLALHADMRGRELPLPRIVPAQDASIDLLWKSRMRGLLVNFPADGDHATYYGKKSNIQTSGVLLNDEAHEELIRWLTQ